jgi:hypothetical protein
MALDDKTINKIKKEIRKGDETLPEILKKLPDILPEKFERKPKLSPEQRKELQGLLEKYKEKKKIIPKVKPDPDKKNTPIIPKDFFKRINPKDFIDPELKKKRREDFFKKFNPDEKFLEPMPYKIDPNQKRPKMEPAKPYVIKPKDKNNPSIVQLLKKGGTVKGYKAGGEVKTDKSPNSGMITKRGWGASRKT